MNLFTRYNYHFPLSSYDYNTDSCQLTLDLIEENGKDNIIYDIDQSIYLNNINNNAKKMKK